MSGRSLQKELTVGWKIGKCSVWIDWGWDDSYRSVDIRRKFDGLFF
jgi:hypothetical protein